MSAAFGMIFTSGKQDDPLMINAISSLFSNYNILILNDISKKSHIHGFTPPLPPPSSFLTTSVTINLKT
jgi:hypothetical protein